MTNQRDAAEAVEAAAKAHCDFFGGEGWWDTGLLTDTRPKALDAMRAAIAAYGASLPAASEQEPVATDEHTVLIAAGLDDYAARCALKTGPEGVFCHAYFYSDGQWRFQTGGNDLHMPDGKVLTCVLTKRLYACPASARDGWKVQARRPGDQDQGQQMDRPCRRVLLHHPDGDWLCGRKRDGKWLDHETHWSPSYGSAEITIADLRRAARVFFALGEEKTS